MTLDEIHAKIDVLEKQIADLREQSGDLKQQWADLACPYKVGDVAVCRGYSHTGKNVRIERIIYQYHQWKEKPVWYVTGTVLKKDGTPSKNDVSWDSDKEPT